MFTILFIVDFIVSSCISLSLLYYIAPYSPVNKPKGGLENKCNDRIQRFQEILYVHSHFICHAMWFIRMRFYRISQHPSPSSIATKSEYPDEWREGPVWEAINMLGLNLKTLNNTRKQTKLKWADEPHYTLLATLTTCLLWLHLWRSRVCFLFRKKLILLFWILAREVFLYNYCWPCI